MRPVRLFTEHPESVGETYGEHLLQAAGFGTRMILGGLACLVHAVLPFLFGHTGSRAIVDLNERMVTKRSRAHRSGSRIDVVMTREH